MNNEWKDSETLERERLTALALQVLHGEFDTAESVQLRTIAKFLLPQPDERCQRAAGYIHAVLRLR